MNFVCRRFGVEIEYNSFDNQSRSRAENDLPLGIYDVAHEISLAIRDHVEVNKWHYSNNNSFWEVKPDSSCGMEVCSTPMRGYDGIKKIENVIKQLTSHKLVSADERCSFHVHVEIEDFQHEQILNMVEKWINFELFFLLMNNPTRWLNQYCVPLGFCKDFSSNYEYTFSEILNKLSGYKYYSINLYHYGKNKRKTIEFRCMGNDACFNPDDAVNWCKLLLCFVERCKELKNQNNHVNLQYKTITEAIDFLRLSDFFDEQEILVWIIEKLNFSIENDLLLGYPDTKYYWKSILNCLKPNIAKSIEKLESLLL